MSMQQLYVLRTTSRSNILGTGSIAFGFRHSNDAVHIVRKMSELGPMVDVWYTKISPQKFVLTKSPRTNMKENATSPFFVIEEIDEEKFVFEMITQNLSVRIIEGIDEEHQLTTLYSNMGYEPSYTTENAILFLEQQISK